jgi:hypothetical protein
MMVLVPHSVLKNPELKARLYGRLPCKIYPLSHPLAQSMLKYSNIPDDLLVLYFPRPLRRVATCHALKELSRNTLKMVFPGHVAGRTVRALFDSGATHSFMSFKLSCDLGIPLVKSRLRAVATATDTFS